MEELRARLEQLVKQYNRGLLTLEEFANGLFAICYKALYPDAR